MYGIRRSVFQFQKQLHTLSKDGPTDTLKKRIVELQKTRKKKDPKKNQVFVEVPESLAYLDSPTLPMILICIGTGVFAKLLMMYDDSKSQERIERKIKDAPPEQGTMRMLSREEWEKVREVRPRTPFESKFARPNARIRTGEPLLMEDLKNWAIDVITDACTRVEESVKKDH
ncbi:hypothetical protein K2173_003682 [Erythroxylum novogranatense]|uniref:Uncharacterized protein n=1 Tax=Erythroxylum novogranatense TaxID=1862640 RepID=A0AAV8TAY9_9ROSI|nr:hypothetical protein K2173_003682 [Erythroxylum novogranatense]